MDARPSRLVQEVWRSAYGARQVVAEAPAAAPDLTTDYIRRMECYRDSGVKRQLIDGLVAAGLPSGVVAQAP